MSVSQHFDYNFKVYLDKCIALIHTMVIKSDKQAQDMNALVALRTRTTFKDTNRHKWIYYLHVSGEYHETDKPMYIISMDTMERILFNKENLKRHRATRKEYSYGGHKYEELVAMYPENELLIKGILNPVDIDKAIEAEDGTILSYDSRYVEINEHSLMEELQRYIYHMHERWYQKQYNIDHRHYNLTHWGVVYQKLVSAVMDIRMSKCLTNEAHSYHYRRFLASHGFLDFYLDYLTLKQCLRLYKNIRWVERYVGQKHTQRWLIRNIMTERNLPIAEFNAIQTYEMTSDTARAIPRFEKTSLNGLEMVDHEVETLNLRQLMDKEDPLAPYNLQEREFEEAHARDVFDESLASELKTKVLESKAVDWTDSETVILPNVLMDLWVDLAYRNMYRAYIQVTHPLSGETIPLDAKNALLMLTLAASKIVGTKDDCIPDFTIGMLPRKRMPNRTYLHGLAVEKWRIQPWFLDYLEETFTPVRPVMTTYDFYEQAEAIFKTINQQIETAQQDEDMDATTYKTVMVYNLYRTEVVSFRKPGLMTFKDFLDGISFDIKGFTKDDWTKLATTIYQGMTGLANIKVQTKINIHKAMIALMTKLSSYSVHYIREINEQPIRATHFRALRVGDSNNTSTEHVQEMDGNYTPEILFVDTHSEDLDGPVLFDHGVRVLNHDGMGTDAETQGFMEFEIDPSVGDLYLDKDDFMVNIESDIQTGIGCWQYGDDLTGVDNPAGIPPYPGVLSWFRLPDNIKKQISDKWRTNLNWDEEAQNEGDPRMPLAEALRNNDLNGFHYNNEAETVVIQNKPKS